MVIVARSVFALLVKMIPWVSIQSKYRLFASVFVVLLIVLWILTLQLPSIDYGMDQKNHTAFIETRQEVAKGHKTILVWDQDVYKYIQALVGEGSKFFKDYCEVKTCHITANRRVIAEDEFSAIILYWPPRGSPPARRKPHQAYIMFTGEPNDFNLEDKSNWNEFYNYTMTFRGDSDFFRPFGYVKALQTAPKTPEKIQKLITQQRMEGQVNYAKGKTKLVAWFVSNCETHSRREFLVHNLQMYVPVDVYGVCGNLSCPVEDFECYKMVERSYKFYFSFENAFCRNYTTEKFFNILAYNVVPVVYGGADYAKLAPPHSYIDATQMTVKELATLLKELDQDDAKYNEFFWWKKHYKVVYKRKSLDIQMMCDLCEKLHVQEVQKVRQVYKDFVGWWGEQNHCHQYTNVKLPIKEFSFWNVKYPRPVKMLV